MVLNPIPSRRSVLDVAPTEDGPSPTKGRPSLLIAGISTLVLLSVLLALGTWQIYRLRWKEGILARIAAAEAAPPVPLTPNPEPFAKVVATGHFRFDRMAEFGAEVRETGRGPSMGYYQIVPL